MRKPQGKNRSQIVFGDSTASNYSKVGFMSHIASIFVLELNDIKVDVK